MGPTEKEGLDTRWREIAWSLQQVWPSPAGPFPVTPQFYPDARTETHGVHCHLLPLSPTPSRVDSTLKIQRVWTTPWHGHPIEDLGLKCNCNLINAFENYTVFIVIHFLLYVMNHKELNKRQGKFFTNPPRDAPHPQPWEAALFSLKGGILYDLGYTQPCLQQEHWSPIHSH